MVLKFIKFQPTLLLFSFIALISFSCGSDEESAAEEIPLVDSTKGAIFNVEGEIFSIPSPIQTALLIKKSGANYNKEMLNSTQKSIAYTTNFQKALNLGVYGADLGYVTIYDQSQDAIVYLNAVKKLADDLGISGAFDPSTLNRFQNNVSNKDSLLVLVSLAYRASDAYLKNNQRSDVSSLILVGGWIESLYFSVNILKMTNNEDVKRRIGEQKTSLKSLLNLLNKYKTQPEYADLISKLTDLSAIFDVVEFKYTYEPVTVDVDKKMTVVNSKTEVKITPEQFESIAQKVQLIRNQIVGNNS